MKNIKKYEELRKEGLNKYSSWCLYDVNTDYILKPKVNKLAFDTYTNMYQNNKEELDKLLRPEVMYVALNWGDLGIPSDNWENFHFDENNQFSSTNPIIYIPLFSKRTILEGAYMTDILKNFPSTDSTKINVTNVNKNIKMRDLSVKLFQKELDILQPKIIVFANETSRQIFNNFVKKDLIKLPNSLVIGHLYHYSMISYDNVIANRQNLLRIENTFRELTSQPKLTKDKLQPIVDKFITHRNSIVKNKQISMEKSLHTNLLKTKIDIFK